MTRAKEEPAVSIWKTKDVEGRRMMICQNSNPEIAKWGDYAPENGECDEWSEVGHNTSSVLCYKCTSRSVNGIS